MKRLLFLEGLSRFSDLSLLLLRLLTGAFLVWGVWDNIVSAERMAEFASFMAQFGFPAPSILAPLSVYAQFACGVLLIAGLFTRWTGVVMAVHFVVGFLMVHLADDFRAQFPALVLIFIGFYFATAGGGRFALDRAFR
jgi:putative oxidoreductase